MCVKGEIKSQIFPPPENSMTKTMKLVIGKDTVKPSGLERR